MVSYQKFVPMQFIFLLLLRLFEIIPPNLSLSGKSFAYATTNSRQRLILARRRPTVYPHIIRPFGMWRRREFYWSHLFTEPNLYWLLNTSGMSNHFVSFIFDLSIIHGPINSLINKSVQFQSNRKSLKMINFVLFFSSPLKKNAIAEHKSRDWILTESINDQSIMWSLNLWVW